MTSNKKKKKKGGRRLPSRMGGGNTRIVWRSCAGTWQAGKRRVRTEHLEVCRHFRDGISINANLCQYANYRRSPRITGMPGRSGEVTAGRRLGMLRMPELNTWRSARKHADPKPSSGGVATVRGRVIADCASGSRTLAGCMCSRYSKGL